MPLVFENLLMLKKQNGNEREEKRMKILSVRGTFNGLVGGTVSPAHTVVGK